MKVVVLMDERDTTEAARALKDKIAECVDLFLDIELGVITGPSSYEYTDDVDTVARAIFAQDEISKNVPAWNHPELNDEIRDTYRRMATAAMEVLRS